MSVVGDAVSSVFGGGKKPKSPETVDAEALIDAQAKANRVNTSTPWGSTRYTQDDDGRWSSTVNLSPELQQAFSRQAGMANSGVDRAEYGGEQYDELEKALYDRQMALLEPQADKQMAAFQQSMSDRGMPSGSEAYDADYANLSDAISRQRERAALDAVMGARDAFSQDRNYNLSADQVDYNQLAALLSGSPQANVVPLDTMGAYGMQNNQRMNQYSADLNAYNQGWQNAGSAGGTAAMMTMLSDERLKTNIVKIGEHKGLNMYSWDWVAKNHGPTVGFMAQEVEREYPEFVTEIDGYKAVEYGRLMNHLEAA